MVLKGVLLYPTFLIPQEYKVSDRMHYALTFVL